MPEELHRVGSSNELSSSVNGTVRTDVPECHVSTKQIPESFILHDGTPDYLRLILTARVYDVVKETPITPAVGLSESLGTNIILKREDLTAVFSFKIRGAYNRIAQLPKEERWRGVIACSAGNHAQGVAFSANRLGIPATIVMPLATPNIKHVNVTRLGGKVLLYGQDFDEAKTECKRLSEKHNLTNIPPFDDPYVIAGQGTIGLEILRQIDSGTLGTVFVPVGGGGLIAGIAVYIKRIAPQVKIVGVETHDADALYQSLEKRKRVVLDEAGIFADGTAVRILGEETFRLCMKYVDEVVLVSTDELCAAIKDIFSETRSIAEPSGALSVAGAKKYLAKHPELCTTKLSHCAIVSGANINFDRLRFVAERARLGEGREVAMLVKLPDHPGTFHLLHSIILPRAVTEFSYRYNKSEEMAPVFVSFTVKDRNKEVTQVIEECQKNGLEAYDLSDCELAKSHVRFMIGGRPDIKHERIFRFSFPEKPGSLAKFLSGLKTDWNITMFHYRNQGADVSQVLAGLFIPPEDNDALEEFIKNLDYSFVEETDNVAYKQFLCA